jgi:hypothetical protein
MQIIALGLWQAVCLAVLCAGCFYAYLHFVSRNNDDDDDGPPDAPGLLSEALERFPFGFHVPSETRA